METSDLTLFQTNITPARNAKVDNLFDYLYYCTKLEINSFQYLKIARDMTIKIDMPQKNTPKFQYNYLRVIRSDDTKPYYYFIIDSHWTSANTISLQLSIDSVNTFDSDLQWTSRTNITRQHKDRFKQGNYIVSNNSIVAARAIDKFEEGISPLKTMTSNIKITQAHDYDHYLIYRTKGDASKEPIECLYCASKNIVMDSTASQNGLQASDYSGQQVFIIFYSRDNADFTYTNATGATFTIGANQTYKALLLSKPNAAIDQFIVTGVTDSGSNNREFETGVSRKILENTAVTGYIFKGSDIYVNNRSSYSELLTIWNAYPSDVIQLGIQSQIVLNSIYDVDRTDTRIVKIIKMPYPPFDPSYNSDDEMELPSGWTLSQNYLLLSSLDTEFLCNVGKTILNQLIKIINKTTIGSAVHDLDYESKLYNSNYYTLKFMYDNFEKEFLLERYEAVDNHGTSTFTPQINIKFKQSNNLSSNSLFDFDMQVVKSYEEPTLYSKYMNVNRSQEVALYTSPYLEYIRNGYNYDKKAQLLQTGQNVAGLALGTTTSVLSFMYGGGVGAAAGISLASSALNNLTSTIINTISSEQSIQQKLQQASMSPASVSSTTDLNLLSYYNGNRLIRVTESCSDAVKQAIYNLFRLTGYACNDYGVPDLTSRIYYNFVQCKADFDESQWKYGQDILNDIKSRYEVGVTVYHQFNGSYDWLQEKENFESWLVSNS